MRLLLSVLLVALSCGAAFAQAPSAERSKALQDRLKSIQGNPAALKAAVEAGRSVSFFCHNCHGEDGIGRTAQVPNLNGQDAAFLLDQTRKYLVGGKDPFKQGVVKAMKDEEQIQTVLFYASLPPRTFPVDKGMMLRGKVVYEKNCKSCHGDKAHGSDKMMRLAGQRIDYVAYALGQAAQQKGGDPAAREAKAKLPPDDMKAVGNYLAQLP
ncbi:MAG: cytochrome c4 [Betaproteobacteria bacterium]|nr:cytochrome c4 [Betaproteobacteria bacterium]